MYASVPQDAAALLESLFDNESHAGELRPGLIDQFYRSQCGVAVGQEIVDEQYAVAGGEEITAQADVVFAFLGKGKDPRRKHMFHRFGLFLFGENHGQVQQETDHDGRCDTARFDGHHFVEPFRSETAHEFHGNSFHQCGIHLMVDEAVHFEDTSFETLPVLQDSLFE